MKRVLLSFVVASLGLSGFAASFNLENVKKEINKDIIKKEMPRRVMSMKKIDNVFTSETAATRAGASAESLAGTWQFSMGDYYFQDSANTSIPIEYEATVEDGDVVYFEDPTGYELPFVGIYDEATSTLAFPYGLLGSLPVGGVTYYVFQSPFVYNYTSNDLDQQDAIFGTYNATAGTITFDADNGIAWEACTDQNGTKKAGYFAIYDLEGATRTSAGNPGGSGSGDTDDSSWTDMGMATFMDGWVLPAWGIDQTDPANQYKVALQQNVENPNVYRLVNPYQSGPAAEYNSNKTGGYIVFDVTDPDHVLFTKSQAGFANSSMSVSTFYCYNTLGAIYADYLSSGGKDPIELVIDVIGDQILYTTFKNGVVSLGSRVDPSTGAVEYDANFGVQSNPNGGYVWQNNQGQSPNMVASITFPDPSDNTPGETPGDAAIDSIGADENAPVIYYNLQGRKVENPVNGIFIKKQGSKTVKVVK